MAEQGEIEKVKSSIKKFLEVYKILTPDAKANFEAKLLSQIKNENEITKKLYFALLKAAKDGKNEDEAFECMEEVRRGFSIG